MPKTPLSQRHYIVYHKIWHLSSENHIFFQKNSLFFKKNDFLREFATIPAVCHSRGTAVHLGRAPFSGYPLARVHPHCDTVFLTEGCETCFELGNEFAAFFDELLPRLFLPRLRCLRLSDFSIGSDAFTGFDKFNHCCQAFRRVMILPKKRVCGQVQLDDVPELFLELLPQPVYRFARSIPQFAN